MSIAENQAQNFLRLVQQLRPHFRTDRALPRRIHEALARERRFGSRDRRFYRELIYTMLRFLPWIEPVLDSDPREALRRLAWLIAAIPATALYVATFKNGEAPAGDKAELLPAWFREHCPELFSGAELDAQLRRAVLWLRVQSSDAAGVTAALGADGCVCLPSDVLPAAWRAPDDCPVDQTEAYLRGSIEIQDLGSQMILASVGINGGECWLDACAGAGGKSLQLAQIVGPAGRVSAYDIRAAALDELRARATRAGIRNIDIVTRAEGEFDGVLVDAPCSGSGTWRRFPHLKWSTTGARVAECAQTQQTLLAQFAARVRPGGRLVYATCSLSARENEDVIATFLAAHRDFRAETFARTFDAAGRGAAGLLILPARHDTDGFFVASLRRR